jgi:DNA helicase-2/ATP-dependent DNA helicase PcrA
VGEKTIAAIVSFARDRRISIAAALDLAGEILSGAMLRKVETFTALMRSFGIRRASSRIGELCRYVIAATEYEAFIRKTDPDTLEERTANLDELVAAMSEFENLTDGDDLAAFLAEVSLLTDVDAWKEGGEALTLMTLHAAKGLEFRHVYIAGVELGLFPLPRSFDEPAELEEERRLFYVGATRAMDRLHLSYALSRFRQGAFSGGASMFLGEIPWQCLAIDAPRERSQAELREALESGNGWRQRRQPARFSAAPSYEDFSQEPEPDTTAHLREGVFVRHPSFGRGQITAISGTGDRMMLTIRFAGGEKKIMAKFGRLLPG